MSPLYLDGDVVAVDMAAYNVHSPQVGDIVLCKHPFIVDYLMIKRIQSIDAEGRYFLLGENQKASTDSRSFGALDRALIIGKVVGKK